MPSPIFKIPDDHVVHKDFMYQMAPPNLWHLPKEQWDKVHNNATGKTIKVAILDTGYKAHKDLPEPVATKSFIAGESVTDGNGHSTHCAGTAVGRNGLGVAPEAELLFGKVLSNRGSGSSEGIVKGVRWAADNGADVISLSLGGGSYEPMREAARVALSKGIILVAAAGNAGYNGSNSIGYPAKYFEYLCIGATRQGGGIANFSSGGREIDIATPGENIISCGLGNNYISMSGTSMATPFAAGLCALIIESIRREGGATMKGVDAWRAFLQKWSEDKGDPGHDVRYGYGVPKYAEIVEFLARKEIKWL